MSPAPTSPKQYIDSLPEDRRPLVRALRRVVRANLDPSIKEGIQYGMLGYFVPHSVFPAGYHCDPKQPLPFLGIGSTKSAVSIHLFCAYTCPPERQRFEKEWRATGHRFDMGKACLRVRSLDEVPLEVLGKLVKRLSAKKFIKNYQGVFTRTPTPRKKVGTKKAKTS